MLFGSVLQGCPAMVGKHDDEGLSLIAKQVDNMASFAAAVASFKVYSSSKATATPYRGVRGIHDKKKEEKPLEGYKRRNKAQESGGTR